MRTQIKLIAQQAPVWLFALLFIFLFSSPASAKLRINLSETVQRKQYPIAITNFKGNIPGLGRKVGKILRNNFKLSGVFRVISPTSFLEKASKSGVKPDSFDYTPWTTIGAEGLLKGNIQKSGLGLVLNFYFYEIGSKKLAFQRSYQIKLKRQVRWYLQIFSDHLYKYLTGEPGIFTTKIAYIRKRGRRQEVWVMDFDGKNQRRLTNNGRINVLPSWSPNGRYIAYTSWKRNNPDLYVVDVRTGRSRIISKMRGLNTGAAWSPNSRIIAFSASRGRDKMDIYTVGIGGGSPKKLTRARTGVRNLSPTWSPDGKKLAFVSTRHGSPQIFTMNSNGSGQRRLTKRGRYNQSPKWSPRGDWILFTGRDGRNVFNLFLISPSTGAYKKITQRQRKNMEADWSPNGRNIVVSSTRAGGVKLFIITEKGKHASQLTFTRGKFFTPSWSPRLGK